MNVAKAKWIIEKEKDQEPVVSYSVSVKIRSKGGMYYTAYTENVPDGDDDRELPISRRILLEAQRKVGWLLAQVDNHGGWWFEDNTMWITKSEIGMLFADVTLLHQSGAVTD